VFTNKFPQWTVGVQIGYPLGASTAQANLAGAKIQYSQAQTQIKNLELQVATQVRDAARQVQTNLKRVDPVRAARWLTERKIEAEEKKFAAGMSTSSFVIPGASGSGAGAQRGNPRDLGLQSRSSISRPCRPSRWPAAPSSRPQAAVPCRPEVPQSPGSRHSLSEPFC
jgi:hypothetical protein